jgi:hypothetical protein
VPVDTLASRATSAKVGAGVAAGLSAGRARRAVFVMVLRRQEIRRKVSENLFNSFSEHSAVTLKYSRVRQRGTETRSQAFSPFMQILVVAIRSLWERS